MNPAKPFEFILVRFAVVGFLNTIFGYFLGVLLYMWFVDYLDAYIISAMAGFISIGFSLMLQRKFVFFSKESLKRDLYRGFIVYGIVVIFAALIFKVLIDIAKVDIFLTQAIVIAQSWIFSYFLLSRFAFSNRLAKDD
jgi:putative flippase GtrA